MLCQKTVICLPFSFIEIKKKTRQSLKEKQLFWLSEHPLTIDSTIYTGNILAILFLFLILLCITIPQWKALVEYQRLTNKQQTKKKKTLSPPPTCDHKKNCISWEITACMRKIKTSCEILHYYVNTVNLQKLNYIFTPILVM